ncbi:MAG: Uma2 family endonuclease [Gammaproteobacteria bacterium]|jgi:Uma2 family endonuclease|uniref:Uma2 family endonuclease n=1 Tax=Methylotuvimicrobium sp. TaxID=2822413 RepID=UPI001D78BF44|nr:Uma2 family endonuclease [Gammaproteobacteria bacterium]
MPKITDLSQLDTKQTYSYADYLTWQIKETVELIKGKVMMMSPAPNVLHQRIERKLLVGIDLHLKNKRCEIFPAPFDVRLYDRKQSVLSSQEIFTVVQPDLCVICNPEILDKQGCNGAPDWIIEILSPGNSKREMQIKYQLYQECGVQEYWLVYPEQQAIHQFVLDAEGQYRLKAMFADKSASSYLFPDLSIDLIDLFASR